MITPVTEIQFDPPPEVFLEQRLARSFTAVAGPNNSGKSLLLKWMKRQLGRDAYMLGANRFYHIYLLSTMQRDPTELDQWEQNFRNQFGDPQFNHEQNYADLGRILMGLNNERRGTLFDLCAELLGTPFELRKAEEDNDLSMRYVEVGGQNISVASTGARLLITLLGTCMDQRFSTILIDEPELGLSPRIQEGLAALLQDESRRNALFPHLQNVFVSTHSQLFLSRREMTDNFTVSKNENVITVRPIDTTNAYHRLQFNLLGNSLESLFLPSAIVIVEGDSDLRYLDRVVQLTFPGRRITVIAGGGDVKRKIYGLREAFGDFAKSPFRSRIFVVLDSVHQPGLVSELTTMGLLPENVITWKNNGIEYVYPAAVLGDIFGGSSEFALDGDRITVGDIVKTKNELSADVEKLLTTETVLPEELEEKFLARIRAAID